MYDFVELQTALTSLNTTGVLADFKLWYDKYFGPSGLATLYYSNSSNENNSTTPLPGNGSGSGSVPPPTEVPSESNSTLPANIAQIISWIKA